MKIARYLLTGMMCVTLAGCYVPPNVQIYNQTGQVLVLHLYHPARAGPGKGEPYDFYLAPGRRKTVREGMMDRHVVLTAGSCDYDYGTAPTAIAGVDKAVDVQISPDFVAHLLNTKFTRTHVDVFHDDAAPGFPVVPKKTCHEIGARRPR